MNSFHRPLLCAVLLGLPMLAMAGDQNATEKWQPAPTSKGSAPLVEKVRRATARFKDIGVAIGENWVAATPCVSGPNSGAMGVHFVLPARVGDGAVALRAPVCRS